MSNKIAVWFAQRQLRSAVRRVQKEIDGTLEYQGHQWGSYSEFESYALSFAGVRIKLVGGDIVGARKVASALSATLDNRYNTGPRFPEFMDQLNAINRIRRAMPAVILALA